jgi:hypothetical protein
MSFYVFPAKTELSLLNVNSANCLCSVYSALSLDLINSVCIVRYFYCPQYAQSRLLSLRINLPTLSLLILHILFCQPLRLLCLLELIVIIVIVISDRLEAVLSVQCLHLGEDGVYLSHNGADGELHPVHLVLQPAYANNNCLHFSQSTL